jgi:uncharacterized membrane protein
MAESKNTRATQLRGETDEEFEQFRDKRDMSTSEALRAMVREALQEDDDVSAVFGSVEEPGTFAQILASLGIVFGVLSATVQWGVTVGIFVPNPVAAAALGTLQSLLLAVAAVLVASAVIMAVVMYLEGDSE